MTHWNPGAEGSGQETLGQLVLDRADRDALHAEAISSCSDMVDALAEDAYDLMRQLRPRIEAVFAFLDEIGWRAESDGERFVVTLPASMLRLALRHLGERALSRLTTYQSDGLLREDSPVAEDAKVCMRVMLALGIKAGAIFYAEVPPSERAPPKPVEPLVPIRFSREERDRLRVQTLCDLLPMTESMPVAVRAGDLPHALELRSWIETDWCVLDAIGWALSDPREEFLVTLPERALRRARGRLEWTRLHRATPPVRRCGGLVVDTAKYTVSYNGEPITTLTPIEFALLRALSSNAEKVFTKDELVAMVWGSEGAASTRTLDSHVVRLRRKLARYGAVFVITVHSIGYRLTHAANGEPAAGDAVSKAA